jgi:hypothetical protein
MKTLKFILISLTIACITFSCVKESTPPSLPPEGSMVMKFDGFWKGDLKSVALPTSNFLFAAGHVLWWNTVLTINLAIPVATFAESFNHEPVWDAAAREWIWSYSVPSGTDIYTAELHGKNSGSQVEWNMYVSKTGGFTGFLWYSGISSSDNKSGTWYLNRSPENPQQYLQIDWIQGDSGTAGITYLNVMPEVADNGSYITYGITNEPPLVAYYDIYGKANDRLVNIKWDTASYAGRVKAPYHFMDSEWHCWDPGFLNVVCE